MPTTCSTTRYYWELGLSILAYAAVLIASIFFLRHGPSPSPWRELLALSPMVPAIFVILAILRHVRRLDELQSRVQMEAIAFAFAGTAFLTFSYGFLEGVGYSRLSLFVVWPTMAALWVAGSFIASRRYQ